MMLMMIEISLLAFVAGMIQAITGFGNAIVMMLGFTNIFDINRAASVSGSISIVNNGTIALSYRKYINLSKIKIITAIYTVHEWTLFIITN